MRVWLAAWLVFASLALPAHGHDAARSASLDAACSICIAAHQLTAAAPAPQCPCVAALACGEPGSPEAALPAPLDAPPALGRAPPIAPHA